jgi:DNA modification methylase
VDAIITDPIYPEVHRKGYPKISEADWHDMMRTVVKQCRRVLKPKGSAVFILQPNSKRLGQMRLWLWEFVVWAAKEWNLVQDAHWWAVNALPVSGHNRKIGLLRPSVKFCVWLASSSGVL